MENIVLSRNYYQLNREEEYRVALEKVTDVSEKEGICLELELYGEDVTELEVTLFPLHIARPEFFPEIRGRVAVAGKGTRRVDIPFEQFEFRQTVRAFLNYLDGISVRVLRGGPVLVNEISACDMGDFQVRVLRDSLTGESGSRLEYTFLLSNQGEDRRLVNVSRILYGRECLPAEYDRFVELAGAETRAYKVTLGMTDIMAFSCEGWSDGIDMMACSDVAIEDVFMRNSDDCIAVYGARGDYKGDTRNVTVKHAVLWADVAHPTMIGVHGDSENGGSLLENISFEDVDILEHHEPQDDYLGCLCINVGDGNTVRNVTYRNIRVEQFERGKLLDIQVKWNKKYNPIPSPETVWSTWCLRIFSIQGRENLLRRSKGMTRTAG